MEYNTTQYNNSQQGKSEEKMRAEGRVILRAIREHEPIVSESAGKGQKKLTDI